MGVEFILNTLISPEYGAIKSLDEINAVGHRMVHGGERFSESVLLNKEVLEAFTACNDLAPLHNPANLKGVNAVSAILPNIPQVGVFDTAFHQTMPDYAYMYAIPYELYEKYGVRRYGFHGTSHRYVSKRVCEFLGVNPEGKKIITCHIGNGGSIAAIKDGKCIDTTMGLTPLEGLIRRAVYWVFPEYQAICVNYWLLVLPVMKKQFWLRRCTIIVSRNTLVLMLLH